MECTALVVYEDWHNMQAKQRIQMAFRCRGVIVSGEQLDRLSKWFDDITETIRRAADALAELFKKLADAVTPVLSKAVDSLKELFDNLDLNDYDDEETVLMKCHNRYNYLRTKQYIAQKQYYNNQFKLARMHICVANHIKR